MGGGGRRTQNRLGAGLTPHPQKAKTRLCATGQPGLKHPLHGSCEDSSLAKTGGWESGVNPWEEGMRAPTSSSGWERGWGISRGEGLGCPRRRGLGPPARRAALSLAVLSCCCGSQRQGCGHPLDVRSPGPRERQPQGQEMAEGGARQLWQRGHGKKAGHRDGAGQCPTSTSSALLPVEHDCCFTSVIP